MDKIALKLEYKGSCLQGYVSTPKIDVERDHR